MEYPIKIKGKTIKQVTKLNLSHKNLKTIPDNVYQYANLEKLDLTHIAAAFGEKLKDS